VAESRHVPRVPRSIIEALAEIDTGCIGDVLGACHIRGIALGLAPLDRAMKLCGPAVTVRLITSRDRKSWARQEGQSLVESWRPGDVMVIDVGGRLDGAPWGGNATLQAINKGLSGTVIDGATRDATEIVDIGYPVFTRGTTLRHTHGYFYSTCLNDYPVQIGAPPLQIMVAPGDIVVGDGDGVVVVPADRAGEILDLAQRRHEHDLKMHDVIRSGLVRGDPQVDELVAKSREYEGVEGAEGYAW
jgi:regulator of RNase E activity RraA